MISHLSSQPTGQSSATLNAAYEGVFSQLDALAAQSLSLTNPSTPEPLTATTLLPPPVPFLSRPHGTGAAEIPHLQAVSERTEPLSATSSLRNSPTGSPGRESDLSFSSIARRFPLPASPVKGPRAEFTSVAAVGSPQKTPKKASDLIKMFEQRGSGEPPPSQPSFAPALSRAAAFATAPREASASPPVPPGARAPTLTLTNAPPPPPSSFQMPVDIASTSWSAPSRSPSPLSQVRNMIATWRARSGTPSQRVVGSPGRGGETPRFFGRDRGWNVSIRRRRRDEGQEETGLAESSLEPEVIPSPVTERSRSSLADVLRHDDPEPSDIGERALSPQSFAQSTRSEPRVFTGEVCQLKSSSDKC